MTEPWLDETLLEIWKRWIVDFDRIGIKNYFSVLIYNKCGLNIYNQG